MNSTIERAGFRSQLGAESPVNECRVASALENLENSIQNAIASAEVIQCGLESLCDRVFGVYPEPCEPSGDKQREPNGALERLGMHMDRLHTRLNRIDVLKNRLVDLA